jgi:hypothetical protein
MLKERKNSFIDRAVDLVKSRMGGVERGLEVVEETVLPLHLRTFGATALGMRSPITEKNLTTNERAALAEVIRRHQIEKVQGNPNAVAVSGYDARNAQDLPVPGKNIAHTFGHFRFDVDPATGGGLVTDNYDFLPHSTSGYKTPNAPIAQRLHALVKVLLAAQRNKYADPGDIDANIVLNGASRPVRIQLSPAEMKPRG